MTEETKDQLGAEKEVRAEESPKGFDEQFEAGFAKYEEEQALAAAEAEKTKKPEPPKKGEEKETRTPIEILKVQGKEIPIYTKEELIKYAQQGIDYTKKRQADADDRRQWESQYQERADQLNALGKRFNDIWDSLEKKGFKVPRAEAEPGKETPEKPEAPKADDILSLPKEKIYEHYGIDPEFAREGETRLVDDVISMRKTMATMNEAVTQSQKALQFFQVREVVQEMARIIDDERKTHPFEDIVDEESGKSLTLQEYSTILASKAREQVAQGKKVNLDALVRETVRDISTKQTKTKSAVDVQDDMSWEDFAKAHPKLAAKFGKTVGQGAVDKAEEEKSKLPPTLDRRAKEVETKKKLGQHEKVGGVADQLEAAFQDEEILAALGKRT